MRRRGFTLLEVVIVVAIVGVVASLGFTALTRHADKTRVQKAARDLAQRIAYARSLAESAGPRIGNPALLTAAAPCPQPNAIAVRLDPLTQRYVVPEAMVYDATADAMRVSCREYLVSNDAIFSETRDLGRLFTPNGPIDLAFTNTGRVQRPASPNAPADWYFEIRANHTNNDRYGYRILPSGIICRASDPTRVDCNTDL